MVITIVKSHHEGKKKKQEKVVTKMRVVEIFNWFSFRLVTFISAYVVAKI